MKEEKKKLPKSLAALVLLLLIASALFVYYRNNLKPDENSSYAGSWYEAYIINPDGTYDYPYGEGKWYEYDPWILNKDGTFSQKAMGSDVWLETDDAVILAANHITMNKDDGRLYVEFEEAWDDEDGKGIYRAYYEKH